MSQRDRYSSSYDQEHDRNREQDDWAKQVPHNRQRREYEDYGWERDQSVLPQFRDPSVHLTREEQEELERSRREGSRGRPTKNRMDVHNRMEDREWMENRARAANRFQSGPFSGVGPKNYQRSDERIKEEAYERLTRHGRVDARNIQIDVQNGEIIMEGTVHNRLMKRMAEMTVENISGVKDVHNRLRLQMQEVSQSGMPGGGAGRVDQVGESGVYPASGPLPSAGDAETRGMASWGQGERGSEGYQDHGDSEIHPGQSGSDQ